MPPTNELPRTSSITKNNTPSGVTPISRAHYVFRMLELGQDSCLARNRATGHAVADSLSVFFSASWSASNAFDP